jgi:hypothetical protein
MDHRNFVASIPQVQMSYNPYAQTIPWIGYPSALRFNRIPALVPPFVTTPSVPLVTMRQMISKNWVAPDVATDTSADTTTY